MTLLGAKQAQPSPTPKVLGYVVAVTNSAGRTHLMDADIRTLEDAHREAGEWARAQQRKFVVCAVIEAGEM